MPLEGSNGSGRSVGMHFFTIYGKRSAFFVASDVEPRSVQIFEKVKERSPRLVLE